MTESVLTRYTPPGIAERTALESPLNGPVSTATQTDSAVFRATPAYEVPAIIERTRVDAPLVLAANPSNPEG